ncbi:MAG: PAS domain S-box protein, partial [bacterium]|nr:PAS domain S-box protein [bacterium]
MKQNKPKHIKILVVDDEADNLGVISGYLKDAGYRCSVASNGNTALKRAARIEPGVILLDIKMPGMDGFEVCRRLKKIELTRSIPVIFLTALDDIESKILGFGAGGVDYITKPVQKEELLARVSTHLENYLYKNKLEQIVERRTEELEQTNKILSEEVDRRKESEENLHITLNSIGDAVIATDTAGCIVRMNPVAEKLTGWQFKAANAKPLTKIFNIFNAQSGEKADNPVKKVIKSGKIVGLANHTKLVAKNGAEYQIADSAAPIRDARGTVTGVVLVFRDVTEDYRVREALRETHQRLIWFLDHSPSLISLFDEQGRYQLVNTAVARVYDRTPEEVAGKTFADLLPPEVNETFMRRIGRVIEAQTPIRVDDQLIINEEKRDFETILFPLHQDNDGTLIIGAIATDITERKQAEEDLKIKESAIASSINAIAMADLAGNLNYVNNSFLQMWGYEKEEEVLGKPAISFWAKPEKAGEVVEALLEEGSWIGELFAKRKNGSLFDAQLSASMIFDANGKPLSMMSSFVDITERKQAEESLRQLNQAMEQSPASVMITDTKGIIQYVNPKFSQVTGYSAAEAIGQNPRILQSGKQPPEFYREMWDTLTAGREWRGEFHNRKKNGELFWELASIAGVKASNGTITHYVAVKEDITQRKQLEEETVRQERLAAVGQLAAGIAHDFNNILTSIIGFANLLQLH